MIPIVLMTNKDTGSFMNLFLKLSENLAHLEERKMFKKSDMRRSFMFITVDGSGIPKEDKENYRCWSSAISSAKPLDDKDLLRFSVLSAFEMFNTADCCIFINADILWNVSNNFLEAFYALYSKFSKLALGAFTVFNESKSDLSCDDMFIQAFSNEEISKDCFGMTRRLYNAMKLEENGLKYMNFSYSFLMNMKSLVSFIEKEDSPSPNFLS